MKVKNMDKYFPFQILRRGYDYYKKGKVKEIIKTKDGFIAKVIGTEEYKVIINANGNQYNMLCSCPYAEDNNCKHMAAVLYCLKNDNLPIKENNKNIEIEEITDFKKFEKEFKKECYKLFRGRNYLNEYEVDDYIDIINSFMKEGTKYIDNNIELAYEIFEFLIMEVDSIDIYDEYNKKVVLFENLFLSYKKIFDNKKIFVRFLAFIGTIYTIDPDECYFVYKREIIDFLCNNIKCKWQAEYIMILFEKMNRDKIIPNYIKENITAKSVYLTYNYINKEEGLRIAKNNLNIKEICDFLLNIYKV